MAKEIVVIRREIVLRVNYLGILVCSATAINRGIEGAIDFLLQKNNKEAKMLRETFIFKIIPILNPDGVSYGNYRCNSVGADLNRRWPNPSKLLHPTIYYTKKLVKMCHQDN